MALEHALDVLDGSIIDNRILISVLRSRAIFHRQKCHQFHEEEIWWTLRKMGSYLAKEYTSQLHHSSHTEVNKFPLAYVILF